MVIDLAIVTAPKPPGSRALISPWIAVLEIAPANVLQGAVRLQGLTSSPTPETQVRVACACATEVIAKMNIMIPTMFKLVRSLLMFNSPYAFSRGLGCGATLVRVAL